MNAVVIYVVSVSVSVSVSIVVSDMSGLGLYLSMMKDIISVSVAVCLGWTGQCEAPYVPLRFNDSLLTRSRITQTLKEIVHYNYFNKQPHFRFEPRVSIELSKNEAQSCYEVANYFKNRGSRLLNF